MFLHIVDARHVSGYRIWVRFEDGLSGEVDLSGELDGAVFEPLRDQEYFAAFSVDPVSHTITWPNGADFAPEFLRENLQQR
jgi:hypothetical protein